MACVAPGAIIMLDWYRTSESRQFLTKVLHKKNRRKYGLLKTPVMSPQLKVDTVCYKVFLSGKSGVGKTTLSHRLAGLELPNVHYETTGIETNAVFWPVKMRESGRILFFHFQLWDCGENALRRFDHMLSSCKEQVDAVLFLFSFTDRGSFEDISNQMSQVTEHSDRMVRLVVGTKFDLFMHTDVTEREITRFQENWRVPVFRVGGDISAGFGEIAPLLNSLAENLWHQDCMNASTASLPSEDSVHVVFV